MPLLRRANKIIIGKPQNANKGLPAISQFVTVTLAFLALFHCSLLDFLSMFIQSSKEISGFTKALMDSTNGIGDYFFVGMPQMRMPIHIIDGCR